MKRKLYDHLITTNYGNIKTKIESFRKKKKAPKKARNKDISSKV